MIKNIKLITRIFLIGILVSACSSSIQNKERNEPESEDIHKEENVVSLTRQQIKAIGLNFIQIEKRNISKCLDVTGTLELAPQDRADVSPILGGIVSRLYVFEGDLVKKGQGPSVFPSLVP